ncbi:hypothetical protein D3C72_1165650 [compost metagenome]
MKNKLKKQKAITLIALIITIVVILILTSVMLAILNGDNGLLNKAKIASEQSNEAKAKETLNLALQEARLEKLDNSNLNSNDSLSLFLQSRIEGIIINDNIVTIDGYSFKIDGTKLSIIESLGTADQLINNINNTGLIGKVSQINTSGISNLEILGKTSGGTEETISYASNIIVYEGNVVLDGIANINGATLNNNVYEFGDKTTDVGTASTNANNMVILKINGNLTINSGVKLTACASDSGYGGPKGLLIYCSGEITNNGEISMTARGAKAIGQNVYLWKNSDNTFEYIDAIGANGSAGITAQTNGVAGVNATGRKTGGGGSGASMRTATKGGAGAQGTSYSGGSGGGGASSAADSPVTGGSAASNGGAGGVAVGRRTSSTMYVSSGGARKSWWKRCKANFWSKCYSKWKLQFIC